MARRAEILDKGFLAGVDISEAMIVSCLERYRSQIKRRKIELRWAEAESLPFAEKFFNKACSVNSIFYWGNARQALSEIFRVLEIDGKLVLCLTCKKDIQEYMIVTGKRRN